jgi:threonine dehydrogenase-like Zn-dependent dehydrogenase
LRLHSPDIQPAGEFITFTFDGTAVTALPGETVAAALIAAGHIHHRTTQKGQPRGVFCGMGVCYDCLLTIDGTASQRACMTQISAGMKVTRQPGLVQPDNSAQALAQPPEQDPPQQDCELLIIGAGPGGLSAAVAAAEAGVKVVIADERP